MAYSQVLDSLLEAWTTATRFATFAQLVSRVSELDSGRAPHVAFETVWVGEGHPFDYLKARDVLHGERRIIGPVQVLRVSDDDGLWRIVALPTVHDGVFHLAGGIPTTHGRWQKLVRWVDRARHISRCYLNHSDFANIAIALQEFGKVEVVHASGRSNRDGSSTTRGFPAQSGFRRSPLDQIAEFEGMDSYARSWALRVGFDDLYFHLRRVAGATFYSGSYRLFEDRVLAPLADAAAHRRELLTGRQRRRSMPVVPLRVFLSEPVFTSRDDTGLLIDLVQDMADMSMAVFHRNPYLHFVVTDEGDGSNFDVMVTVPDQVDVFPGFRASAESLARVTGRIAERFGALRIERAAPEQRVSLSDLAGV